MSRVDPVNPRDQEDRRARQRGEHQRPPVGRTPGKAEGDEKTVEEALRKQVTRVSGSPNRS
jgi:hypothetical protein